MLSVVTFRIGRYVSERRSARLGIVRLLPCSILGACIAPGTPLRTASSVVEIAEREREWDAFVQIGTHSSTESKGCVPRYLNFWNANRKIR